MSSLCFHCDEIIPKGINLSVNINNVSQPMCCIGCEAVASVIVENNLTDYYRFRTEPAKKGDPLVPQQLSRNQLLDDESLQDEFTFKTDEYKETILTIEGISCAACAWLIEMQLSKSTGVIAVSVNATTQRATIKWQDHILKLSDILKRIDSIGYKAFPFKASKLEELNKAQSKSFIKRLGISGILMMQVLMIAVGLYFGAFSDMSEYNSVYLRWASLVLTLPIVTYGAFPFYRGAINTIKMKRLSMDVPVSIAITLAFSASAWATFSQQGEVYFESVAMFTFLLLIGKFLEFRARMHASHVSANLLKLMPITAIKLIKNGTKQTEEIIAAKHLKKLDLVLIKPGETIPADGIITSGTSQINESMLSGEQTPVNKNVGDNVLAGTINGDGNIIVEVKKENQHSFLNQMIRLSESSQAHKPKLAQLSDKIAQYFVATILLTSVATAIYWQIHLPEQAFWITLSVLVATCPCALSLATPTALTCATVTLNNKGILIKSAHVMETLPKIDCFAFDKTGTLTTGEFVINNIEIFDTTYDQPKVLAIAAGLESHSEHPLAKAFIKYRDFSVEMFNIEVTASSGVSGNYLEKNYKIGKPSWLVPDLTDESLAIVNASNAPKALYEPNTIYAPKVQKENTKINQAQCILVVDNKLIAAFFLEDSIRDNATTLIKKLHQQNISTLMLSGDNQTGCDKIQSCLNLSEAHSQLSAKRKVALLKQKQITNVVAMVGDGVNDTPVFGVAHISIAMGSGTDIAKNGADIILLNSDLSNITALKFIAKKTNKIIWQNYLWAFSYNALVLPLAMAGYITPYLAVIGMSASSILVVTNSLRLLNIKSVNQG